MTSSDDPASERTQDPLEHAQARLDEACARVAARLDELAGRAPAGGGGDEIARLQTALSQAQAREAALADAAQEASDALAEAMDELRRLGAREDGA